MGHAPDGVEVQALPLELRLRPGVLELLYCLYDMHSWAGSFAVSSTGDEHSDDGSFVVALIPAPCIVYQTHKVKAVQALDIDLRLSDRSDAN